MNRTRLLVVASLMLVAIGGGQPLAHGGTLAPQPSCGAVITADTTLLRDLIDCPGDGIVIGAANVTLDLNRHTIDGDAASGALGPDIGIRNDGFGGVTVEGGTVKEFDFGVRIRGVAGNSLLHLLSTLNSRAGIRTEGSEGGRLVGNTALANGTFGIILFGENDDNLVQDNTAADNGGGGVGDFVSSRDRIVHNVVSGNGEEGIAVGGSSDSSIEQNSVSDNFGGIVVFGSDRNTVAGNRVFRNRDDVIVDGDDNSVLANHVSDALGCDEGEGCGFGISVEGGARNLIARNVVSSTLRSGIRLDAFGAPVSGNVFRDNIVHAAGADGIAIDGERAGPVLDTLLEGNLVTGAKDDGIDVDNPSTTLTGNLALHNGDLGIEAVVGVTDGGRNHAAGNGNPAQCINITC
jgi:parallel beta-helix repeat protein